MTVWEYLDRVGQRRAERARHGLRASTERHWVTIGLFGLAGGLLLMARENENLWNVKLFELILQAVIITGLLNMVGAFHFAANKSDEAKTANTAKMAEAVVAAANAGAKNEEGEAGRAAGKVADAAQDEADRIKGEGA